MNYKMYDQIVFNNKHFCKKQIFIANRIFETVWYRLIDIKIHKLSIYIGKSK